MPGLALTIRRFGNVAWQCGFVAAALLVSGMHTASAQTWTWVGNTNGNTNTASNWSPSTTGDWNMHAIFNAAGSGGTAINWDSPFNIGSITFTSSASAYTMSKAAGFQFTVPGVDSIANNSANLQTFSSEVRVFFNGSKGFNANTGNLSLGDVTFRADGLTSGQTNTLTLTGAASGTIGGTISQSGNFTGVSTAITKTGSGTWTLNGNNTYDGFTTVNQGTLVLGHANALGTSTVTVNGGTLDLAGRTVTLTGLNGSGGAISLGNGGAITANIINGAVTTYSGAITGTGSFTKGGNGGFILASSNNTYVGDTIISNNWIRNDAVDAFATNGVLRFSASSGQQSLYLRANQTFAGLDDSPSAANPAPKIVDADGNISSTLTLNVATGTSYAFAGYLRTIGSGVLSITKNGAGTQVFSGRASDQVTYTGPTTINAGVLEFSGANSVADNSAITLAGGTVRFSGGGTRSNTIAGSSGGIEKTGANLLSLTGANTFSGVTTVSAGTLSIGSGGTSGSIAGNIVNNASLIFDRSDASTYSGSISGGGRLTKQGAGALTLSGNNSSFSGTSTLSAGTLILGNANALGTSAVTVNGGTLDLAGQTVTLTGLNGSGGTISLGNGGALTANIINSAVTTFSGAITGTGSFTKGGNGGFILASSNNTYVGDTIISNNWIRNDAVDAFATNGVLRFAASASQLALYMRANQTFAGVDDSAGAANAQPRLVDADGNVSSTLTLNVATGTSYTYAGYIRTIGSGTLSVTKNGAGTQVLSGRASDQVTYTGPTTINAGVLEFSGANSVANNSAITLGGGTVRFAGGGTRSNTIAGTGTLEKTGANLLALTGSHTFSGLTSVSAGTLAVNGSIASAVNVANAATLGGAGTINGLVTVAGGGILAPGNSPGTLTMTSGLSLADSSILNFELVATDTTIGGGINDLIVVTGDFLLDGILNVAGTGDFSAVANYTKWRLFNYSGGTFTDGVLTLGTMPSLGSSDKYFAIDTATVGQVNLVIVPEPGALALAGLGIAAAWALRRRLKKPGA